MFRVLMLLAGLGAVWIDALQAGELTATERLLKEQLGGTMPDPIRLWSGEPPEFARDAAPEIVENARLKNVSVPTIIPYLPPPDKATGMAIVVCAGGGYGGLDWQTHVVYAARVFNPLGVAIVGLKYRTRPPNGQTNQDIQRIALLDAHRALRLVRHHARDWKLDPAHVGIAGYSAGGNLAINAACHFDAGDPAAVDPIERLGCRPDFAIGLATWHWREKASPFKFPADAPPVFLVHATNDGIGGGAPIEMPRAIRRDLEALGVPVRMVEFDQGGHGVGNLIPQRVKNGFPPAQWPQLFLEWHAMLPRAKAPSR